MDFIHNKQIDYIDGYFNALSDMSGKNNNFFAKVFLTKNSNLNSILEALSSYMNNTCNIINKEILEEYSLTNILSQLIVLKPYSALYGSLENNIIPKNIENEYKEYITNRLSDTIYDIYKELEKSTSPKETSKLTLILAKNTNENNCIILIETKNNYSLIFYFYYPYSSAEEYISLYKTLKYTKAKSSSKAISASGLPNETVDRLARVLNKIQSQGFMNDELKNILLEYHSEDKIIELKNIFNI